MGKNKNKKKNNAKQSVQNAVEEEIKVPESDVKDSDKIIEETKLEETQIQTDNQGPVDYNDGDQESQTKQK